MKLFLSWSGKLSRDIAVALHDWLPYVIQNVKPFVSTGDIDKGNRWGDVLATELKEVAYGIIILTRENVREPWINFEAGAISKALEKAAVSPFLFGVEPGKLEGPLQQFQATVYQRDDVFNLLRSINARLPEEQIISFELLRKEFEAWWPDLEKRLTEILARERPQNETGFPWLYTASDLAGFINKQARVWIVAPHLYRNVLVGPLHDVIVRTLKTGSEYTFIVPAGEDVGELQRLSTTAPGKVQIRAIDEADFQSLAVTDYILLDPDTDAVAGFLELPIESRGYWINVDREAAIGFVGRFRRCANGEAVGNTSHAEASLNGSSSEIH